jgi:coenzyme PQQ synthesis protein D (PqqD)
MDSPAMSTVSSTSPLALDTRVVASSQQVSCDVANEAVLLSMHDGEYYGLNEVAATIWKLVQQPRTISDIRDALLNEYTDIDPGDCERAVLEFLSEMIFLRMVETL